MTPTHREMSKSDVAQLKAAIQSRWSGEPSAKARRYIGSFFTTIRTGKKIVAQVEGNHGTYTVSLQVGEQGLSSARSCYIGKAGFCHHCEALVFTFAKEDSLFKKVKATKLEAIQSIKEIKAYLEGITLESLIKQLADNGITQKAFAEGIGMNPRQLSAIKSSELRNRYFNELGATKLACLWILEHVKRLKAM